MDTIYNIYDKYYRSILGSTSSKLKTVGVEIDNMMNSYKERFIKIIVRSANLNDHQEEIFRDMVDDAIRHNNAKYITCQFPKQLVGYLIAASDKTLNQKDFRGFPADRREWDFSVDTWRLHFVTKDSRLNVKDLFKIPENKVVNYTYDVVRFGKTVIVRADTLIYVWVDGLHKVVAMMGSEPTSRNRPLDRVVE